MTDRRYLRGPAGEARVLDYPSPPTSARRDDGAAARSHCEHRTTTLHLDMFACLDCGARRYPD